MHKTKDTVCIVGFPLGLSDITQHQSLFSFLVLPNAALSETSSVLITDTNEICISYNSGRLLNLAAWIRSWWWRACNNVLCCLQKQSQYPHVDTNEQCNAIWLSHIARKPPRSRHLLNAETTDWGYTHHKVEHTARNRKRLCLGYSISRSCNTLCGSGPDGNDKYDGNCAVASSVSGTPCLFRARATNMMSLVHVKQAYVPLDLVRCAQWLSFLKLTNFWLEFHHLSNGCQKIFRLTGPFCWVLQKILSCSGVKFHQTFIHLADIVGHKRWFWILFSWSVTQNVLQTSRTRDNADSFVKISFLATKGSQPQMCNGRLYPTELPGIVRFRKLIRDALI